MAALKAGIAGASIGSFNLYVRMERWWNGSVM
jgi:hypothetical protein